jgi:DNA-binding NtrC family response regulator
MPPLRERPEDIPLLAHHFLRLFAGEMGVQAPEITAVALAALDGYAFPGNVRELKNMMEFALLRSRGEPVRIEHLNFLDLRGPGAADVAAAGRSAPNAPAPEAILLAHVRQHGSIDNTTCRELLSVSQRRASYLLGELVHAGLLVSVGSRRWARYRLPANGAPDSPLPDAE